MLKPFEGTTFAELFKKYRLRSEIETLSEFGDLLAEEGMVYETSLFTRWQKGERIPKDRRTILAIVRVFAKRGSIHSIEDVNLFFESVNQRNLDLSESEEVKKDFIAEKYQEIKIKYENKENTKNTPYILINKITTLFSQMSSIKKALLLFYGFIVLWYLRLQAYAIQDTNEVYIFTLIYSLIALLGGINGFLIIKKLRHVNEPLSKSITFFSLGLLSLWIGQTIWCYYNIIAKIEVPYPSLADLGFMGVIPLYSMGSLYLGKAIGLSFEVKSVRDVLTIVFTPITLVLVTYFLFLNNLQSDNTNLLLALLNFLYPFGESIMISIIVIVFILSFNKYNPFMVRQIFTMICALVFYYLTDYTFVFIASKGSYYNGGFVEILYATSFLIMALAIDDLQNLMNFNKNHRNLKLNLVKTRTWADIIRLIKNIIRFTKQKHRTNTQESEAIITSAYVS